MALYARRQGWSVISPWKNNVAKPKGCEVAISPNLSDVRDGSTVDIWRSKQDMAIWSAICDAPQPLVPHVHMYIIHCNASSCLSCPEIKGQGILACCMCIHASLFLVTSRFIRLEFQHLETKALASWKKTLPTSQRHFLIRWSWWIARAQSDTFTHSITDCWILLCYLHFLQNYKYTRKPYSEDRSTISHTRTSNHGTRGNGEGFGANRKFQRIGTCWFPQPWGDGF